MNGSSLPVRLALLFLVLGPAAADPPSEPRFLPDASLPTLAELRGSTWVQEDPGFVVRLQKITELERQAYIQKKTGLGVDPFATPPDESPAFVTFLIQLENRGDGSIEFQPPACWLVTNAKKIFRPVGLETLRSEYRMLDMDLSPAYDRVGPAILEHGEVLDPGQSVAGLLVFRKYTPRTRSFQLDVPINLPDGRMVQVSVPYAREPKQKKRKEG